MQNILVAVDLQNDFIDGALGTKEAVAIVPAAEKRIREFQGTVLFTRDTHGDNYMETEEGKNLPVPHCIKGTEGWEIRKELEALRTTEAIDKPVFGSEELGNILSEMNRKETVGSVTFIGLCTDICVISNAMIARAFLPNAHIIVDCDACAGVTPESHSRALEAMAACQVEVIGNNR
ncbi:MAG: cysteine hydrolase [Spirochaetales bacterium]|nr:cysteine hydrolase [Candidatus Physcosoma equi]